MKYWLYSYMWKNSVGDINFGTGYYGAVDMVALYEHIVSQPEDWCLTHVVVITRTQYDTAEGNGKIG